MKVKDQESREVFNKNNSDPYGNAIIRYAERWADLMEATMAGGAALEDVADPLRWKADSEGITGYMHGCAMEYLATTWEHGERLRRWHNIDTQIGNEGEKANEGSGVLNPALLHLG